MGVNNIPHYIKYNVLTVRKKERVIMKIKMEETKGLKNFTVRCLMNEEVKSYEGSKRIIAEYWEKAKDIEEFKKFVLDDERLKFNQGYAELSKESDNHWYRVRQMFGDRCFKTYADGGSVKIGNDSFSLNISNGYGDGTVRVSIFTKEDRFNENMMNYTGTALHGEFNIYEYDCGDTIAKTMNGDYFVYIFEGLVAFVEWK